MKSLTSTYAKLHSRYNNRVDMHEYYSYTFHCSILSPHQILYLSRRQSFLVLPNQAKTLQRPSLDPATKLPSQLNHKTTA